MSTLPRRPPGEPESPNESHGQRRFPRVRLPPEQRRMVKFIVILVAVMLGWAAVSILVVAH